MTAFSGDRSFRVVWPLMVSQTIGAFNDNAMKAMLPLMAAVQFGKASMDTVNQQVSVLLIIPFVIFAPIAGWVTDRFSKKKVIQYALLGQLLGLGLLGTALYSKSLDFSLAGFFILSVQSAFFSPAKKGILKELIGTHRLAKAVGFMEMLAMVGILGGAFFGAIAFDQMVERQGGWGASLFVCGLISLLAFFSWVISWPIPETKVVGSKPFNPKVMVNHFQDLIYLLSRKKLRYAALGDAWFWGVGGFFYLVLVKLAGEVVTGEVGMGKLYGYWFLLLGVGIMVGSLFVAYLNRGRIEIGLSAIGATGMSLVFLGFCLCNPLSKVFEVLCLSLGFFGALFFVPLNGYIQDRAEENERGRVLAASNLLTQITGILLIALHAYLSNVLGMSARQEFLVILIPSFIIGLITIRFLLEDFFRVLFHILLRIFYRITVVGMENFPKEGGCLLVSNHLSYADPVFIGSAFPRKIRYLAYSGLANSNIMRFVFRLTETLTVSPDKSLQSIRESIKRLKEGIPLCVFAEGGISRTGMVLPFMRGPIVLGIKAGVPVIPVHLDGVWGSIFSMDRGKFFKKLPNSFPFRVTVRVGKPISQHEMKQATCQNAVMELGRESWAERSSMKFNYEDFVKNHLFKKKKGVFYRGKNGSEISHFDFLKMVHESKTDPKLPVLLKGWINEIREVISGDHFQAQIIFHNWMRMKETHFWDYKKLRIEKSPQDWAKHWIPWSGVLWGRTIQDNGNAFLIISEDAHIKVPVITLSGMVTKRNGLVSINALSDGPKYLKDTDSNQKIYKENTLGRLIVGYNSYVKEDNYYIRGFQDEEKINVQDIDEDGFLIPD